MVKQVLIFAFIMSSLTMSADTFAGIRWIDVGVNGLTCSLCTRSVEMSIRRVDFVDTVMMSLETTEGRIYVKPNVPVNLEEISKAVVNAGFSVRFITIKLGLDDVEVNDDGSFAWQSQLFKWIDYQGRSGKNEVVLQLIDDGFLPKKEASKFKKAFDFESLPGKGKVLHVIQKG